MSELLKSGLVGYGTKSDEEIIKTWEKIGLLDGISDELLKLKVALTLDNTAKILLCDNLYIDSRLETFLFPITRIVFSLIYEDNFNHIFNYKEIKPIVIDLITAEFITEKSIQLYPTTQILFDLIYSNSKKVDIEAEICSFIGEKVAELFIRDFKDK